MRAIVIATNSSPQLAALNDHCPALLLPLLDRPFLQHVVEFLIDGGITRIDFVLTERPEAIEEMMGDGTRWGSQFEFHLARDSARPYSLLSTIAQTPDTDGFLLVHADRLPRFPLAEIVNADATTLLMTSAEDQTAWTGWGWIRREEVPERVGKLTFEELETYWKSLRRTGVAKCSLVLNWLDLEGILAAQRLVFEKQFPEVMLSGRETDNGVWFSRNVVLNPTASVVPPVYLGQNCRIGRGVRLGPHAVIGHDCLLDDHCTVANSVILPGSYVGQALELDHVIVDRNRLINVKVGTAVSISDDFILSGLRTRSFPTAVQRALSRLMGLVLLVGLLPILAPTWLILLVLRKGKAGRLTRVVRLPADPDPAAWRTFPLWSFDEGGPGQEPAGWKHLLFRFIPGLPNVVLGNLGIVGLPPRAPEGVAALPHDWRTLYLSSKAGLISETLVVHGARPTEDEAYTAESFYSVNAGLRHDLMLFLKYLGALPGTRR